mmetsp:Transcript_35941/g.103295  ORF Transcript_35941/g.103295 Transcript_35941/m.103295 type:complete len:207 (-) Transcript_35941:702-1322(-)
MWNCTIVPTVRSTVPTTSLLLINILPPLFLAMGCCTSACGRSQPYLPFHSTISPVIATSVVRLLGRGSLGAVRWPPGMALASSSPPNPPSIPMLGSISMPMPPPIMPPLPQKSPHLPLPLPLPPPHWPLPSIQPLPPPIFGGCPGSRDLMFSAFWLTASSASLAAFCSACFCCWATSPAQASSPHSPGRQGSRTVLWKPMGVWCVS